MTPGTPAAAAGDAVLGAEATADTGASTGTGSLGQRFSVSAVVIMAARAGSMLALPFLARGLGVDEYGLWDTALVVIGFGTLLGRLGMDQAVCHFVGLAGSLTEIRHNVTTGFLVLFGGLLTLGLAVLLLFPILGDRLFDGQFTAVTAGLIAGMVVAEGVMSFLYDVLRFTANLRWYLLGVAVVALLNLAAVAGLYGARELTLHSALAAYLVIDIVVIAALGHRARGYFVLRPSTERLVPLFGFGLPLIMSTVGYYVMNGADRFFLAGYGYADDLGRYAMAYRIAFVVNMLTSAFAAVWTPHTYAVYRQRPEVGRCEFAMIGHLFLFGLVTTALGVAGLAEPIVRVLGGQQYLGAVEVLPLLLGALLSNAFGNYFCVGIDLSGKSYLRAFAAFGGAALNTLLNVLLIPDYGLVGAGIATFAAYLVTSAVLMAMSQRQYRVEFRLFGAHLTITLVAAMAPVRDAVGGRGVLVGVYMLVAAAITWCVLGPRPDAVRPLLARPSRHGDGPAPPATEGSAG